jgi:hypothetical protein
MQIRINATTREFVRLLFNDKRSVASRNGAAKGCGTRRLENKFFDRPESVI